MFLAKKNSILVSVLNEYEIKYDLDLANFFIEKNKEILLRNSLNMEHMLKYIFDNSISLSNPSISFSEWINKDITKLKTNFYKFCEKLYTTVIQTEKDGNKKNEKKWNFQKISFWGDQKTDWSYLKDWLRIGMDNYWIKQAYDPEFNEDGFVECKTIDELIDYLDLENGNWSLGNAFFYRDLCFIQQIDGGDEWLTIKGTHDFNSITFKSFIERDRNNGMLEAGKPYANKGETKSMIKGYLRKQFKD